MQRYFAISKEDKKINLTKEDEHHIKNVMRGKIGDNIETVVNNKLYLCLIKNLNPLSVEIEKELFENNELNIELSIAVSLVSEQKFDIILQKLTELGVTRIIPIRTSRSIIKIDSSKEIKKIDRWQKICKEASEQSHRCKVPIVEEIKTIDDLLKDNSELKLVCSLNENTKNIGYYLDKNIKSILFTIGPEGGFSKEEEDKLLNNSFKSVTLGKRVLRVETATMYVASIINYIYEG